MSEDVENIKLTNANGLNINGQKTYIFEKCENQQDLRQRKLTTIWQIIVSVLVSLICLPFGIMLGWPSPTYVILLEPDAPLPITLVQSPMIAGFLMLGNIAGIVLSTWKTFIDVKRGLLLATLSVAMGWALIWQSTNIFYLLGGRFLIGIGNGFALKRIKSYISAICSSEIALIMNKLTMLIIMSGVPIAYAMGFFLDFRQFALTSVFLSIIMFFMCFILIESVKCYQTKNVLIRELHNNWNHQNSVDNKTIVIKYNLIKVFKEPELRNKLFFMIALTFVQQFSGAPATIVYCQYMFNILHVPESQYCALVYGITLLLCFIIGFYYMPFLHKRKTLLISTITVFLVLIIHILILYFNLNALISHYLSFLVMLVYIITYSLGLGTVPFSLNQNFFPAKAQNVMSRFQLALHSLLAVFITKLFQVFYAEFEFYYVYVLFASVAFIGILLLIFFWPNNHIA